MCARVRSLSCANPLTSLPPSLPAFPPFPPRVPAKKVFEHTAQIDLNGETCGLAGGAGAEFGSDLVNLPVGGSEYYVVAEIYTTSDNPSQGIIGWGNYGATNNVNALRFEGLDRLHHYWWSNDLTTPVGGLSLLNSWHWVATSYHGSMRRIMVDGVLKASDYPGSPNVLNHNFCVGKTSGTAEYFTGYIRNVAIYNYGSPGDSRL